MILKRTLYAAVLWFMTVRIFQSENRHLITVDNLLGFKTACNVLLPRRRNTVVPDKLSTFYGSRVVYDLNAPVPGQDAYRYARAYLGRGTRWSGRLY